jgi:hypothetical protein
VGSAVNLLDIKEKIPGDILYFSYNVDSSSFAKSV